MALGVFAVPFLKDSLTNTELFKCLSGLSWLASVNSTSVFKGRVEKRKMRRVERTIFGLLIHAIPQIREKKLKFVLDYGPRNTNNKSG